MEKSIALMCLEATIIERQTTSVSLTRCEGAVSCGTAGTTVKIVRGFPDLVFVADDEC